MQAWVYAVHHFQPENEDELGLSVGDRIEVLERDEDFGDGWWQVLVSSFFELQDSKFVSVVE
jgi:hypothetical protein